MHWTYRLPIGRPSPVLDRYGQLKKNTYANQKNNTSGFKRL